ncbi:family 43 glycosylhydrolase [Flammeovirgaceae bacterium SG7u.111]|nr:family 43 glycosylhydrolase [Flammeovirgaceae bacterium SG7u.132]WPO35148.1 family 43 glycosylhydrolase [Flammeovirgaceae bacterium SG7u.111]
MKKVYLLLAFMLFSLLQAYSQENFKFDSPGAKNPIIPGWFADPTIVKIDNIYYIYATTDNEMLASGAPTLWYSKDFQNWYNYTMEVPSLESVNLRNFWAPDLVIGNDGKYYLYFGNCQAGCNIYGYVSDTPYGPWAKLHEDDTPVIRHSYPREGFPSLDVQFFTDDDGKTYAYWGTWVHYNNGYAVGQLDNQTMDKMFAAENIPLEQTPEPFEAPYMMKRNGKYILMYSGASCHDETYNVRYSYSDSPYGSFTPGQNNPILSTNANQSVHGPGHHSILKNNDDYYIVYHRHDYPFTAGGLARQICIDSLVFENDSTIRPVVPSHQGIANFETSKVPEDIAFLASTSASSSYHLESLNYDYKPSFATDNNNATMWKAANNTLPQDLTIDLGEVKNIKRIMTQFEFASYYYQYKIEHSADGKKWEMYVDKSTNMTSGSPMIDDKNVAARYLKLTVLGTEKVGLYAAVWNIKVYKELFEIPLRLVNKPSAEEPAVRSKEELLVSLDLTNLSPPDEPLKSIPNKGSVGGSFTKSGEVFLEEAGGTKFLHFKKGALTLKDRAVPKSLAWNGAYTVAVWAKNPDINKADECLVSWCDREEFYLANSYNALFYNRSGYGAAAHLDGHFDLPYETLPTADQWHHIVLTFDGVVEKVYVDGLLNTSQNITLASATDSAKIILGASDVGENYTGYLASVQMYDYALSEKEVKKLMGKTKPKTY